MRTPEILRIDDTDAHPAPIRYERIGYSWAAVAAGVAITLALTVWFAEIGLALNLAIIDRSSDIATVGLVNGILWVVTGLIALFAGTWVAGRMSQSRTALEGGLHGVGVWAASAIMTLILAFGAAGAIAGGALNLVGSGLSQAGEVVTAVAPSWDTVRTQLESAAENLTDSVEGEGQAGATAQTRFRDESRLFQLADDHFTLQGSQLSSEERSEFVTLVAARLNIPEATAQETLAQWDRAWAGGVERYESAREGAIEFAAQTQGAVAAAAGWAALAMLLGLVVAAFGGAFGTVCRIRDTRNDYALEPNRGGSGQSPTIAQEASRVQLEAERRDAALRSRTSGSNAPVDSSHQR